MYGLHRVFIFYLFNFIYKIVSFFIGKRSGSALHCIYIIVELVILCRACIWLYFAFGWSYMVGWALIFGWRFMFGSFYILEFYIWLVYGDDIAAWIDCRSELWRDVSRNGIFWCPFLVLGIGYWVFGYIHTYICIYIYWVLGIGVYTYMYTHLYIENGGWGDITWSIIMKKHMVQTNAQYQICVMSMEVCFDMMVHGRSSWNNIRPKPRLNTKMSNLLWMICIMYRFHMMYMVITEATYDPSQDPIPVCRI